MNLIEELNSKRYTVEKLSDEYYDQIGKSIKKYFDGFDKITEDNFISFAEEDLRMEHISYEEFQKLVKLYDEHEIILKQNPVGRFSDIPGGKQGKDKRDEIRRITNRALTRRLSQEMTYEETNLIPNFSSENFSALNDRIYEYLNQLGYKGEEDPAIPEIVRENFKLYMERKIVTNEVNTLLESWSRMKCFLEKYNENSRVYTSNEGLKIIFEDKPINSVRKEINMPVSFDGIVFDEKKKALEKFSEDNYLNYKARGFDAEDRAGKIGQALLDGIVTTSALEAYQRLHELGFNEGSENGSQIVRSGFKLFADLTAMEEVKGKILEECLALYSKILYIDKGREYLLNGENIKDPNPTQEVFNEVILKSMVERGYEKGKYSLEDLEEAIQRVENDKESHKLRLPSSLRKKVRDIPNKKDYRKEP